MRVCRPLLLTIFFCYSFATHESDSRVVGDTDPGNRVNQTQHDSLKYETANQTRPLFKQLHETPPGGGHLSRQQRDTGSEGTTTAHNLESKTYLAGSDWLSRVTTEYYYNETTTDSPTFADLYSQSFSFVPFIGIICAVLIMLGICCCCIRSRVTNKPRSRAVLTENRRHQRHGNIPNYDPRLTARYDPSSPHLSESVFIEGLASDTGTSHNVVTNYDPPSYSSIVHNNYSASSNTGADTSSTFD